MDFNVAIAAPAVPRPQPLVTPSVQAALTPAVAAAQQTTTQTRTQTTLAAPAAGRSDAGREPQTGTQNESSADTLAYTVNARTNAAGYGRGRRGGSIDVNV